jgi:hypothetical protein
LVKELNTIVQFALLSHSQNVNKQVQVQYQLELKKQQVEKELNDCYDSLNATAQSASNTLDDLNIKSKLSLLTELNNLITINNQLIAQLKGTNPLMSVEFVSNYSAIQTSIRNTFGFIRINQQQQQQQSQQQQNAGQSGYYNANKQPAIASNFDEATQGELSILCDMKSFGGSGQSAANGNLLSSNSTASSSGVSSGVDLVSSPISTMNKKHASTSCLQSLNIDQHTQWKSASSSTLPQRDFLLPGAGGQHGNHHNELVMDTANLDENMMKELAQQFPQQHGISMNFQSGQFASQHACLIAAGLVGIKENSLINMSAGSIKSTKSTSSTPSNSSAVSKYSPTLGGAQQAAFDGSSAHHHHSHQQAMALSHHYAGSSHHGNPHASSSSRNNPHHNHHAHLMANGSGQILNGKLSSMYEMNMKSSIQLTRSKMIYHCKFGEFGINDGQFTEPSGVTINTNNDIIVADTNSHRIQIFDREGNFKFKFGECGKRDGQLLYPNRVSIVKQTGDIVVTERSPTHQIQIYNKYGQFLRKFGATILQHPRGVCVDYKGRIVVVECKVMRVIIFDLYGNVLNKFNCSKYLEFPNGVCCSVPNQNNNYKEEIYISDNRYKNQEIL